MAEIAAAYPDEGWPSDFLEAEEFEARPWHQIYFHAFDALQYDRHYGAMGGDLPIYYTAISQYCRDHGIEGDDRRRFSTFINAVDAEHLKIAAETAERNKPKDKPQDTPREYR